MYNQYFISHSQPQLSFLSLPQQSNTIQYSSLYSRLSQIPIVIKQIPQQVISKNISNQLTLITPVRQISRTIHQQQFFDTKYLKQLPNKIQVNQQQVKKVKSYQLQSFHYPSQINQEYYQQQQKVNNISNIPLINQKQIPKKSNSQSQINEIIQSGLNLFSQQEIELEQKFQEAIYNAKCVSKHKNSTQINEQQIQDNCENYLQLQDLALQYEDGFIYRGQGYQPALREGFGILSDQNENEVYIGYWKNNKYCGKGKLIIQFNFDKKVTNYINYKKLNDFSKNCLNYEGTFKEGNMNGKGTINFINGEKFEGEFNDGMINGQGIFITNYGNIIKGFWKDGIIQQ